MKFDPLDWLVMLMLFGCVLGVCGGAYLLGCHITEVSMKRVWDANMPVIVEETYYQGVYDCRAELQRSRSL